MNNEEICRLEDCQAMAVVIQVIKSTKRLVAGKGSLTLPTTKVSPTPSGTPLPAVYSYRSERENKPDIFKNVVWSSDQKPV